MTETLPTCFPHLLTNGSPIIIWLILSFEIVDQLEISALEGSYTGSGSDAYHPRMMLALLFYCYATGTFSSRKMEAATYESVPVRYVVANQHPDHDTICTFRRRFLKPLSELFVQILEIAHQMELVEIGDVAIVGNKARANASKHKAMKLGASLCLGGAAKRGGCRDDGPSRGG